MLDDGRLFGWMLIGSLTFLWIIGVAAGLYGLMTLGQNASVFNFPPDVWVWLFAILTFTLIVLWAGLIWVRWQKDHMPVPQLSLAQLLELEPEQFERHVGLVFRKKGFHVRHRGHTGDHGVDLEIISKSGRLGIIQCKRYRSTVGEQIVRDLYGTMLHEGAAHAFLVTAGHISSSARVWAADKPITLIEGERLVELARSVKR